MTTIKDQLNKLIVFIDEVSRIEGNEWFKDAVLAKLLFKEDDEHIGIDAIKELSSKVELIKKYLLLDVIPIIDYSDIKDERVRNQLFRDSIEMSKYRLGKINNQINFDEFCRYAHLQAEELINYYFHKSFNNISLAVNLIKECCLKYNPSKEPANLNYIDYKYKLSAYSISNKLPGKTKSVLEFLSKMRNELSHRNSLQKEDDDKVMIECEKLGFNFDKFYDTKGLEKGKNDLYYKGKHIYEKRYQNFNEVYDALTVLKKSIVTKMDLVTDFY